MSYHPVKLAGNKSQSLLISCLLPRVTSASGWHPCYLGSGGSSLQFSPHTCPCNFFLGISYSYFLDLALPWENLELWGNTLEIVKSHHLSQNLGSLFSPQACRNYSSLSLFILKDNSPPTFKLSENASSNVGHLQATFAFCLLSQTSLKIMYHKGFISLTGI